MNCRDLETQLTPYLDGELIAEARVEFEAHLARCPACSRQVEIERHNLGMIREAVRPHGPMIPEAFRVSLFKSIARDARRQRWVGMGRIATVAASMALTATFVNQQYRSHQRKLYEQDAAMRHARHFPLEIQQSPDAIERWFGGKLDHPVTLPHFFNTTAAGARLLQVRDKPAAYIRYDSPRSMGLFVYGDDHDVDVGTEPAMSSSHGYNVVSWRAGDVVYQLVTDLDESDIRELLPPSRDDDARQSGPETQPASFQQ